jgi:hypothetical protein
MVLLARIPASRIEEELEARGFALEAIVDFDEEPLQSAGR